MSERIEILRAVNAEWAPMMKGLDFNMDAVKRFYRELAMDIKTQKERIGGDWAVAHVVINREFRDLIRWWFRNEFYEFYELIETSLVPILFSSI